MAFITYNLFLFLNNYNVNNDFFVTNIPDRYAIFHILDRVLLEIDQYQLVRRTKW